MAKIGDNLELYLSDVYEKECVFKIDKDEVDFIQRGVETLVQKVVDRILLYDSIWDEIQQDFVSFQSQGGKIVRFKSNIIKVGSFYEGTKNDFPGEFDLIYPFYCCEETKCMNSSLKKCLQRILDRTNQLIVKQTVQLHLAEDRKDLHFASADRTRKLFFDRLLGQTRPAMTMNFIYESIVGLRKEINVDLVPAAIIKDSNLGEIVDKYCTLETFRKEVMSMGRILMVHRRITFTETEVHIMRDKLSQNHRKVYRILKFLINGNGEGHGNISRRLPVKGYSSYMIKTMIIYHHFKCTKPDHVGLGPCMLEVLNEMCTHEYDDTFPNLLIKDPFSFEENKKLFLLSNLQAMTNDLMLLQKSEEVYSYERYRTRKSLYEQNISERYKHGSTDDFDQEELEKMNEMSAFIQDLMGGK